MKLKFEKPKKLRSTKEHNEKYMNESGHAWNPNMSEKDNKAWKAKHIKGKDERIEIRKSFHDAQVVIIVFKESYNPEYPKYDFKNKFGTEGYKEEEKNYKEQLNRWRNRHGFIRISTNGKINMTLKEYEEFQQAIEEAKQLLHE